MCTYASVFNYLCTVWGGNSTFVGPHLCVCMCAYMCTCMCVQWSAGCWFTYLPADLRQVGERLGALSVAVDLSQLIQGHTKGGVWAPTAAVLPITLWHITHGKTLNFLLHSVFYQHIILTATCITMHLKEYWSCTKCKLPYKETSIYHFYTFTWKIGALSC